LIIEDGTPEFMEKMKTTRMKLGNLTNEELIAEMEKKLDCKIWIDSAGEWHFKPNKR
jgi:hypothetical protein